MPQNAEKTSSADHLAFYKKSREILSSMERKLSGVVGARENDFLALGAGLNEFHGQSLELADLATEMAGLTSGEAMTGSLDKLSEELGRMTDLCELSGSEQSIAELDAVNSIIDELEAIIVEFGRIVKKLSMLGISTRIESARLGSKGIGFSTLADDVEKLANNIVNYSGQIVENAKALSGYVDMASSRTRGIIGTQKACSLNIFENLNSNIESLSRMTSHSSDLSKRISEKTKNISDNISQAVLSMQFHDIVRQQVEHVEQAVHDMKDILDEKKDAFSQASLDSESIETVAWAGDVLQLQCSQLDHSRDRFVEAVESMLQNLQGISENILDISEDIRRLMSAESGEEGTALAGVERGITFVSGSLREFAHEGEELGKLMTSVAETIATMSSFVVEIEEVGAEIELIAINASIKAAHTGEEGAALGVLASAIQGLSVEARKQTDAVSGILGGISASASVLQENASGYYDQSKVEAILSNLEGIVKNIQSVDRDSREKFRSLRDRSDDLGKSIREMTRKIDFHTDVAGKLEEVRRFLAEARGLAQEVVPLETDRNRSERLQKLYERYTMETERDVHEAAFGANSPGGAGRLAESEIELFDGSDSQEAGAGDDGFGDNVDLF